MGCTSPSLEALGLFAGSSETGGRVVRQSRPRGKERKIHLFQSKGTEITHQRNVPSACSPWCGRLDPMPTGHAASCSWAVGSGQGEGAPGILSHRRCDFGRRGQADAYVQPILT